MNVVERVTGGFSAGGGLSGNGSVQLPASVIFVLPLLFSIDNLFDSVMVVSACCWSCVIILAAAV